MMPSFNRIEVQRLEIMGGAVLAKFHRLTATASASAHMSPAQQELAAFMKAFEQDPNLAAEVARDEAVAAAEAAEAARRVA
jgi:hypothetical protein